MKATDRLIVAPTAELIALARDRVFVRHEEGSFVIEATTADVLEVLSALDGSTVEEVLTRLPSSHKEFARTLLSELLGTVVCMLDSNEESQSAPAPTIAVIGNGRFVQTLHRRLTESLGECHLMRVKDRGEIGADRFPRRSLRDLDIDRAEVERLFAESDIVICIFEHVVWAAYSVINKVALASPRAAAVFVSSDSNSVTVGPVVRQGRGPCFVCERLFRLGVGQAAEIDEEVTRAFASLAVDGIADRPGIVREGVASAVAREAVQLGVVGAPRVPASAIDIALDGKTTHRTIARLRYCPDCRGARSQSHHTAFHWDDPDAKPTRPAEPALPFERGAYNLRRRAVEEAEQRGASMLGHSVTNFRDHLDGTWRILTGWGLPDVVCLAGQYHSVYGSDAYELPLFAPAESDYVRGLIGKDAERLVRLFCTLDRPQLARQLDGLAMLRDVIEVENWRTKQTMRLRRDDAAAIVAIEIANSAEQTHAGDLTPGIWIARCVHWAKLLADSGNAALPPFGDQSLHIDDERRARALYLAGVDGIADPGQAQIDLRQAIELNPLVGEPLLMSAHAALLLDDRAGAAALAAAGREKLWRWHCSWDKRAPLTAWLAFAAQLDQRAAAQ